MTPTLGRKEPNGASLSRAVDAIPALPALASSFLPEFPAGSGGSRLLSPLPTGGGVAA